MTLTEFLLARIAEDEAAARAASPGPWHTSAEGDVVLAIDEIEVCDGFALSGPQLRATTEHIARHDPDRALRRCERDRRIVELHDRRRHTCPADRDDAKDQGIYWPFPGEAGSDGVPLPYCPTLRSLVAVYADHPDYRAEWRP